MKLPEVLTPAHIAALEKVVEAAWKYANLPSRADDHPMYHEARWIRWQDRSRPCPECPRTDIGQEVSKCPDCGRDRNPVDVLMGRVCGPCTRKLHKLCQHGRASA